jgi:hypothetical protein
MQVSIETMQRIITDNPDIAKRILPKSKAEMLTAIAQEHLNFETLEERKSDSLDFKDVGVLSVKAALEAAYAAGRASRKGA